MLITLLRTIIIYLIMIFAVRLMGKRQIGELQPGELVITLIISNVAVTPIQDKSMPLLGTIIAIITLVCLEIFKSFINLKSIRARTLTDGNAIVIIRDGILDQKQLKQLRLTVDDVLEALRKKDIFDISNVQYALLETDGNVTAMLKSDKKNLTPADAGIFVPEIALPYEVIIDGKTVDNNFSFCNMTRVKLEKLLKERNLTEKDVLLMTVDKNGAYNIIEKEI